MARKVRFGVSGLSRNSSKVYAEVVGFSRRIIAGYYSPNGVSVPFLYDWNIFLGKTASAGTSPGLYLPNTSFYEQIIIDGDLSNVPAYSGKTMLVVITNQGTENSYFPILANDEGEVFISVGAAYIRNGSGTTSQTFQIKY